MQCSGNDLSMYDTVYDDISTSAMALVRSLLKKNVNVSIVPQVQKQDEMWIMVYSVLPLPLLLHGLFPGPYKQSLLGPHLISCFENKAMTTIH